MFYVYCHTVPNGKMYIGQTKDPIRRWNNGEGYADNRPFYKDIQIYGWNNIKHEIISNCKDMESALKLESVLIALLNTENEDYGYNQTNIREDAMKRYVSRAEMQKMGFEDAQGDDSFFELSGLPVSACNEMIDQWIFNEEYRSILKSRLIDGMSYPKLSQKYCRSVRQLKTIVYKCCEKLQKHF